MRLYPSGHQINVVQHRRANKELEGTQTEFGLRELETEETSQNDTDEYHQRAKQIIETRIGEKDHQQRECHHHDEEIEHSPRHHTLLLISGHHMEDGPYQQHPNQREIKNLRMRKTKIPQLQL